MMKASLIANSRMQGVQAKGLLRAHKWWLLRRLSQATALLVFMLGPIAGIWIVRGNFASSELLGTIPLSDPFIALQSIAAGNTPTALALIGAATIVLLYVIIGGRAYCGWVCPVNVVTDTADWLREKLGITRDRKLDRRTRVLIMLCALLGSIFTGTIAWEMINPVSILQRGLIFGMGAGWFVVLAVFLLDLFVTRRGWCSHICPVGAFYGVIGRASVVRVAATRRESCTNCGACFRVCPEPQIISPALHGSGTRVVDSGACLNCGGCIDACPVDVFEMSTRWSSHHSPARDTPVAAPASNKKSREPVKLSG